MSHRARTLTGRLLAAVMGLALFASVAAVPGPTRAAESVERALADELLDLMNGARLGIDLRQLGDDGDLATLASLRARHMARTGQLSHTTHGGTLANAVSGMGLEFVAVGEAVGTYAGVASARIARLLFQLWRDSPPHWDLISSVTFNYVGVGVSMRSDGAAYAALVFAETTDRTPPTAAITSVHAVKGTVTWKWTGSDATLQTRTAGVCNFDVQYRQGSGTWKVVRARTPARVMALDGSTRGTVHAARVRARDCAGNLSGWSAPKQLHVP